MQIINDEVQPTGYEEWLAAAKAAHPAARHTKQGQPGWVHGYGEANDEEFVTGPDMQADVVAVWRTDRGFGWVAVWCADDGSGWEDVWCADDEVEAA